MPLLPTSLALHRKCDMKFVRLAIAIVALSFGSADVAFARAKPARPCADQRQQFSWGFLLPGQPAPQPNGCSPAVHQYNRLIGQDPDPNIRFQLKRDPATGYAPL
jgi:hypothetical protein